MRVFVDSWARDGKLIEIEDEVSSKYEVAALCAQREYEGLPILFHNVDGRHTVIMNLLGSRAMLAEALNVPQEQLLQFLVDRSDRSSSSEDGSVAIVEHSPTREVVTAPKLNELPILTYFKDDGGAYITGGIVIAEWNGIMNASFHRMLVLNENRVAARLVPSRHLYKMYHEALEHGEYLKVGIAIGVDPLVLFAAATRVPPGKEFEYAASLKRCPVELFKLDNGIAVPHAEFAFEGVIGEERAREGPFLDITGTYDLIRDEPVITLTRMYHRKEPIYHAILPAGKEHQLLMGVPYEPLIYRAVEGVARVRNVYLTDGGCCYLHAVVQITKEKEGEPKNAIIAAFAAHPSLKRVIVVDEDVNPFDQADVEYAVATRVRWHEDLVLIPGVKGSTLDPSSQDGLTTKVGIDATKPLAKAELYERVVKAAIDTASSRSSYPPSR
jgi:UbiD family decarboxylase